MDIKKTIEGLVSKINQDNKLVDQFKKNPKKTVQSLIGDKISENQIKQIIDGIKAKISVDKAGEMLDQAKGFFKK